MRQIVLVALLAFYLAFMLTLLISDSWGHPVPS